MKLKILPINPWIYDFAAYNLWSRPLGLLKVAQYLSAYDVEIKLIDCTGSFISSKFGTGKFITEDELCYAGLQSDEFIPASSFRQ